MTQDSPKVVFLLGAGASVDAGCPTVFELVESFRQFVESAGTKAEVAALDFILARLNDFEPIREGRRILDVELLLSTVQLLSERGDNPLSAFASSWTADLRRAQTHLSRLLQLLEEHIRAKCTVSASALGYLAPLRDFVSYYQELDVFSLNYDTAIEMTCQRWDIPYTDGFDAYWNPALFRSPDYRVRLHKLHGSLLWYVTSGRQRKIVKIPIKPLTTGVEFFSEDSVSTVLIYPTLAKEQHVEPYATLIGQFRSILGDANVVIAVGCSFRDDYIKRVLLEKMAINSDLQLVIVDPNATEVLRRSDELLSSNLQFASLSRRILPLPFTASDALQGRRLLEVARTLGEFVSLRSQYELDVLGGNAGSDAGSEYGRGLLKVRHIAELAATIRELTPFPEPRTFLWSAVVDSSTEPTVRFVLSVLFAALSPHASERSAAFDAARSTLLQILEYVVWDTGRGSLRTVPNSGAKSFGTHDELIRFFAGRRKRLTEFASEIEAWARVFPWGLEAARVCDGLTQLCDDLRLCAESFDEIVRTKRYASFDPFAFDERSRAFPRCANDDLLKELGRRWNMSFPASFADMAPADYALTYEL